MKNILIFMSIVLLASCGASTDSGNASVEDLNGLIKEKEQEVIVLKSEIDSIKRQIMKLDPEYFQKEVKSLEVLTVKAEDFKSYYEVQGLVSADEEVVISSEMPGRLTSLYIELGSNVTKGQLIGIVDTEASEKQIEELKKSMELANDVYDRQKKLWDQNIGSEIQYLQAKNNKERLEKTLISAQTALRKSKIYAPMSGSIALMMAEKGEVVSPGVPIARMMSTSKVKLLADVPEKFVRNVKKRDRVLVKIPALDYNNEVEVSRVGNYIHPNNRTFEVEARLSNPGGTLKPNLLALMYINDYSAKNAIVLAQGLVQQDISGEYFVFAVKEEKGKSFAEKRMVEMGRSYDGKVEIKSGIEPNDKVITTGFNYLADGQEIKTLESASVEK
jgi:membrane fusion protein, multidrug efflux system